VTSKENAIVHVVAAVVMAVSGLSNLRIYYKYRQVFGEHVSSPEQIRRLLAERKPEGYIAVAGTVGVLTASAVIFLLLATRR
jgi:hypothetical protein